MSDDVERPILGCHPCSERLPIVLSGPHIKPVIQVPASIAQYLRDYQRDGVRFLYQRFRDGEGGILADEMGLGKTIQAIAFMSAVLQMKGTKEDMLRHCPDYIRFDSAPNVEVPSVSPVLIVCPASLVENWFDELTTWGYFKVFKMTSGNKSNLVTRARQNQYDVLIVSFEAARLSIELLNTVDWTCIFVDEVHRIKDSNAKLTKALNSLRCRLRYGLTGTPFQNNLKEVYCLLKWSNPQVVDDHSPDLISKLMEKGCRSSATKKETTDSIKARRRFREMLKRLTLRRTKEIIQKHLPSKTDQVVFCEPTAIQRSIYRKIIQSCDIKNFLNERKSKVGKEQQQNVLIILNIMQKTANHPGLLTFGSSKETNKVSHKICYKALMQLPNLENVPQTQWNDILSDETMSGKMIVLSNLLPELLEQKDKILIFSYSRKVLDLIQKHIVKERYTYCRLDGSTPLNVRCAMVRSYNMSPDPAIFLISTKAGGVGLNITGANVVIIFDPSWNPACDLQAQDRAYRLGQKRDVRIFRLLTTSTIEEFVYLRQVYKQQLSSCSMTDKNVRRYFDGIQGDPKYYGELFGVKNLFTFRESDRSLTEELLNKQQKMEAKLLQKLVGKSGREIPNILISECPLIENKGGIISGKSGLGEMCEELFGASDYDEMFETYTHEEVLENKYDEETRCKDMNNFLRETGAVRNLLEHKDIVGPSVVEDFISICALRDVKKQKKYHLPAFDCSIGTQESVTDINEETVTFSNMKMKFYKIAQQESLTPQQLALKVMSLSKDEKCALLNKYQKRQQPLVEELGCSSKRFRLPSDSSLRIQKSVLHCQQEVSSCSTGSPLTSIQEKNCAETIAPQKEGAYSHNLNISKEATVLMDGLFFNKNSNPTDTMCFAKTALSGHCLTEKELSNSSCSPKVIDQKTGCPEPSHCTPSVVDQKTGCSVSALSMLDSLFFSSKKRNVNPPKNCMSSKVLKSISTDLKPAPFSSGVHSILNNSLVGDICKEIIPKNSD
ncbi:DNA excision repair protein ERCC-6-like 2 [Frankliniella fusca]|uniref:DNA repair and recombination protein RAD54-like n=1 Tax=Frankliniella fusca TaxID=407009 RepID=A0AAE1GUX7_9NEOP|nr:DNA excision repair protein ERCC-6-like 2 [Frankliniella fusca]